MIVEDRDSSGMPRSGRMPVAPPSLPVWAVTTRRYNFPKAQRVQIADFVGATDCSKIRSAFSLYIPVQIGTRPLNTERV